MFSNECELRSKTEVPLYADVRKKRQQGKSSHSAVLSVSSSFITTAGRTTDICEFITIKFITLKSDCMFVCHSYSSENRPNYELKVHQLFVKFENVTIIFLI